MKKLLYLFLLIPALSLSQIPGTPNASGVVQPGPPWATGTNTGTGELEGHLDYIDDKANINTTQLQDSLPVLMNRTYYFVSNSGDDNNTGLSEDQAWKTIAKVNASTIINYADVVLFKRGDEWREQLTIDQSGIEDYPITFTAYGTGDKPIINAADVMVDWVDEGSNIWSIPNPAVVKPRLVVVVNDTLYEQFNSVDSLISENRFYNDESATPDTLYIYSTSTPDAKVAEVTVRDYGIYCSQESYITLSDLEVRHAGYGGVFFIGPIDPPNRTVGNSICQNVTAYRNRLAGFRWAEGYTDNMAIDCTASYNGNNFITWVDGDNTTVTNCTSIGALRYAYGTGAVTDGTGLQFFESDNCVVEYSNFTDDKWAIFFDTDNYDWTYKPEYVGSYLNTARYNIVEDCNSGMAFTESETGDSVIMYYNVLINCGDSALTMGAVMCEKTIGGGAFIYNNTIYNDGINASFASVFLTFSPNIVFKNNISWFNSWAEDYRHIMRIYDAGAFEADYNQFYKETGYYWYFWDDTSYDVFATWQSASSQDANSQTGDPSFIVAGSNFILKSGSACINQGVDVGLTEDILGNPIVGLPDIGAYEKQ